MLCERILTDPWFLTAECVMAYAAIPPEPELRPVLQAALEREKTLLLPKCRMDGTMTARVIRRLADLIPGAYGILEPGEDTEVFPPERIQLILTPGMAFSRDGARLGRGKGYYDRFLQNTGAKTIGVCYDEALMEKIPVEPHDRHMDAVITDRRTIRCGTEGDAWQRKRRNKR